MIRNRDNRGPGLFGVIAFALCAGLGALSSIAPVGAQEPGAFLKGQTVRFYVGFSPGGGYDLYARMLAPHFERLTGATVVVENRPGGGGLTALNQLVRNKPDGLSMMMLNGESGVMAQLTGQAGVAFDMTTVSLLGRVTEEPHLFLLRPGLTGNLKELLASGNTLKFSATSRIDNLGDFAAATCEALRMNCQIITGYKGSKEAGLAVMNGEVDGLIISEGSGVQYSQGGKTQVVATVGRERSSFVPNVPTVYELFQLAPDRKWWLDFRIGVSDFGRVVVAPPGLPQDRLKHLQDVWRRILTDPQVIAEGARTNRSLKYLEPAKLDAIVHDLLRRLAPDRLKDLNEVLLKKFS